MVNPFPLARGRRGGRARPHHNPVEPYRPERAGLYRPRLAGHAPHHIPEGMFSELFAALGSHRDRALVAFSVSTGARASELPGASCRDADPGQQLITVIRKGTRHLQQLPASPDAFVWLRLCQAQMHGLVPAGPDDHRLPASAHRAGHHPAGEEHASIAGRVRDLIGPAPNRRPSTPTGSAPLAREIWQPSDPTDRYTLP
jgi:integrase